jgi:pimeloyl-ACP methyl ester carboxylesterase
VTDLVVDVVGEGETVVLVHGSGFRDANWSDQRELAGRYRLVLPFRRGYAPSPAADPDFDRDAEDIADLLDERAHLVGFSYGGIGALLAAARRPEPARSVTAIEPPAFGVAAADPAVQALMERLRPVFEHPAEFTPAQFGTAFGEALGFERPDREPDADRLSAIESFMRERSPNEAEIPFGQLEGIPVLLVSGGWHPAFDAVCDVLEERLGAERAVLPGKGHAAQHAPGFNERLVAFWESCGS